MKEQFIIGQLKKGDENAFRHIYERHYVLLCRYACQLLEDASLAEEVVDDAIFYLWEHRTDIEIVPGKGKTNSRCPPTFPKGTWNSWNRSSWKTSIRWDICWSRSWRMNC